MLEPIKALSETLSEKLLEFFYCEACITSDTAHRKSIDRVVAWNGYDANSVGHDHMFALANDSKPGFLESLYGIEMVDARNSRHC